MRFGFHFLDFTIPGYPASIAPTLRETAVTTEQIGGTWFSVMDHFFQMEAYQTSYDPMLEGWSTLAYVAAVTQKLKLGTIVTGVTYRHPGILVKTATTLDVLSEGRAFFGVGAAWYEREHKALGVPFPPLKERFERLEETIQIALQMWSDDDGPYDGTHYQLAETICVPQPISKPRPPIVIGGTGEQKTLRMVAQYGDACNIAAESPEFVAGKLAVLREHCDRLGRDYESIEITIQDRWGNVYADSDAFLASLDEYAALGVDRVHLRAPSPDPIGYVRRFGEELADRVLAVETRPSAF